MVLILVALLMVLIALVVMLLLRSGSKRALIAMLIGLPILSSFGLVLAFVIWIDHDYMIPEESNFFDFKVTQDSGGNGNYWVYGEDSRYYYSTLGEAAQNTGYQKLAKIEAESIDNFDPLNHATWVRPLACPDIVQRYWRNIPNLYYQGCTEQNGKPHILLYSTSNPSDEVHQTIEEYTTEEFWSWASWCSPEADGTWTIAGQKVSYCAEPPVGSYFR